MKNTSQLKRNLFWNTAGQLLYTAALWLLTVFVVRFSADNTVAVLYSGYLQTALTVTSIFLSIASFGMYNYQVSDTNGEYAQSVYVRSRVATCGMAVVLCGIYVLLLAAGGAAYDKTQMVCIFLLLGYRLVESASDVNNAALQKHERLDLVGIGYALRGVVTLVCFSAGLLLTQSLVVTLSAMLAGNLAFFTLYTVPQAGRFTQKQPVEKQQVTALLAACLPLAVYTFLNTLTSSVPKLLLERLQGTEALGIYGPVTAPVLLLTTCAAYLFTPFITTFSTAYAAKEKSRFYKALAAIGGCIVLLLVGGVVFANLFGAWALRVFIDPLLAPYAYLLAPMVIAAALTAFVLFLGMVLTVMRCQKVLVAANCAAIVVAFVASFVCIPAFGLQGATIASCLALGVQMVWLCIAIARTANKHFV